MDIIAIRHLQKIIKIHRKWCSIAIMEHNFLSRNVLLVVTRSFSLRNVLLVQERSERNYLNLMIQQMVF